MALNEAQLKNDVVKLLTDMMQRDNTSIDEFATRLSSSITSHIKNAEIVYTSGLIAPNGAVTGVFNGNLK